MKKVWLALLSAMLLVSLLAMPGYDLRSGTAVAQKGSDVKRAPPNPDKDKDKDTSKDKTSTPKTPSKEKDAKQK